MRHLPLFAVLVTLITQAIAGEARTVRAGDTVTLNGTFSIEKGIDNLERTVRYQAMKLNEPINIEFGEGREDKIQNLKLWLQKLPPEAFAKHRGKQLIVSGRIHYYSMGPSTFPNPAKLEVFSVKPVSTSMRPNPSLQGTLRDEAAQRP